MASKQEIRHIVEGHAQSGMTRREYCEKHNIPITTLDYWRRMQKGISPNPLHHRHRGDVERMKRQILSEPVPHGGIMRSGQPALGARVKQEGT